MCPQICIKFKCSLEGQEKREREGANIRSSMQYWAVLSRPVYAKPDWGTWNLLGDKLPRVGYWTTDLMVSYTIILWCVSLQKKSKVVTKQNKTLEVGIY